MDLTDANCGNCKMSRNRASDSLGRESANHVTCTLKRLSPGAVVRHKEDWCDQHTFKEPSTEPKE